MATRDGHDLGRQLVHEHGWSWGPIPDPETIGDRLVIDPVTHKIMTPHQGMTTQRARDLLAQIEQPIPRAPEQCGDE